MTFVIQSVLLLISGVYYPIEVLPPWMQVLSHLSPATYVLDGVRGALIHGRALADQVPNLVAAGDHGDRVHPAGAVGIRPGGALRQAHRQVEARRVSGMNAALDARRRSRASAGTSGSRMPSRTSVFRPGLRRPGSSRSTAAPIASPPALASPRPGFRAGCATTRSAGPTCRSSAIGWRVLGPAIQAVLPRRIGLHAARPGSPGRRPVAGRQRRHRVPRDLAQPRLQPPPAGALPGDGVVERRTARRGAVKADLVSRTPTRGSRRCAPLPSGCRSWPSASPWPSVLTIFGHPLSPGRTAVFLGSSGVGKSTLINALAGDLIQAVRRGPRR